jgi:hypothetical protein
MVPGIQAKAFEIPEGRRKAVVEDRDVYTQAKLEVPRYDVRNAMVVRASLDRTRRILTHFDLFAGLVPYIDRSVYDPRTRILDIAGGIWKYRLEATLQFREEARDRWSFRIIKGHFLGMTGAMEFRQIEPGRTLVTFEGSLTADKGAKFPPRLIIEQGAQIIFAVTGRRVRFLVEDPQFEPQEAVNRAGEAPRSRSRNESERPERDPRSGIPQPRRNL